MGEVVMSAELFNDNGISYVAAAFFTGLFTLLGIVARGVFDTRTKTLERLEEVSREATEARDKATQAQQNTIPLSAGFIDRMDKRLETFERLLTHVEKQVESHMNWHMQQQQGRRNR